MLLAPSGTAGCIPHAGTGLRQHSISRCNAGPCGGTGRSVVHHARLQSRCGPILMLLNKGYSLRPPRHSNCTPKGARNPALRRGFENSDPHIHGPTHKTCTHPGSESPAWVHDAASPAARALATCHNPPAWTNPHTDPLRTQQPGALPRSTYHPVPHLARDNAVSTQSLPPPLALPAMQLPAVMSSCTVLLCVSVFFADLHSDAVGCKTLFLMMLLCHAIALSFILS